jgi:hypothetical protein
MEGAEIQSMTPLSCKGDEVSPEGSGGRHSLVAVFGHTFGWPKRVLGYRIQRATLLG